MHSAHDGLPSTEQLEAFFALAELLHFQDAADVLGISQPALSRRIQALEATVGVELFDRSGRSVALTNGGAAYLEASAAWRSQLEDAQRRAQAAAAGEHGRVNIGFVASAGMKLIPSVIRQCR